MLIKTRLRVLALLPLLVVLAVGAVLGQAKNRMDHERAGLEQANAMLRINFELNILTQEYLLYQGTRARQQLQRRHGDLGKLLAQHEVDGDDESALLAAMQQGQQDLGRLYEVLWESNGMAREPLVGALLVKAQDMRAKAGQFADLHQASVVELQARSLRLVMATLAVLAFACMMAMALLARRLERGISELDAGLRRAAVGDLDYRLAQATSDAGDELGALGLAFNDMSQRLQDSHASIDTLRDEVARRQQAEEDVRALNDTLAKTLQELRGLQQTTLLEQLQAHDATLNLLEDAVIARERSEAANTELSKFSLAIEQSPESIVITNLDAEIQYVNAAFVRNTGYAREEVIGRNPRFLQSGKTPRESVAALWSALGDGRSWKGEFINWRKDGSEYVDFAIITPLHQADGRISHYVGVQEDITERRRMARELDAHREHLETLVAERTMDLAQARDEAQRLTRVKSEFLANMSHEIRTPMNGIIGLAIVLAKTDLPAEPRALVRKIQLAARSLLGIINDILDFSKIEAGRIEIEQAPFRLDDILDNLATLMSANAGAKEIELVILPPGMPLGLLRGDALRLGQVLINLVGNAIKFTEQGHVEVAVRVTAADERQLTLRFSVTDTGIGIAADQQQHIFAAFSQADSSTARRFGGTGLGLTISHRLVALMGGELRVDSVPGVGSEFWFSLALERAPEAQPAAPETAGPAAPLGVLIADDSAIALEALRCTAEGMGWATSTATSGDAAVRQVLERQARGAPFQVVILDWKMPGTDGLAAARAIRGAFADERAPIVLMVTAHARDELLAQPDAALADAMLSKPVTASSLQDAVARALHARRRGVAPADTLPVSPARRLAGLRLLVVDDVDINRDVAQLIFADAGAEVTLADDGRQAVDWLLAHPGAVDIVLMDVQMPVMDGIAATRLIRNTPALAGLPVLALTAGVFQEQRDEAAAAGMLDVIAKPFDEDVAIAMILKHAGRAAPPAPATPPRPDFPGIDLEYARTIWTNGDNYRRYLRMFAESFANFAADLARANRGDAAALAHQIKGTAATLGLDAVAQRATVLEDTLHADGDPSTAAADLLAALDTALASIARFCAAPENRHGPGRAP